MEFCKSVSRKMEAQDARHALERSQDGHYQRGDFTAGQWATDTLYVADVWDGRVVLLANCGLEKCEIVAAGARIVAARRATLRAERIRRHSSPCSSKELNDNKKVPPRDVNTGDVANS